MRKIMSPERPFAELVTKTYLTAKRLGNVIAHRMSGEQC